MDDAEATSFTPLYAIDKRGVQLFAAPYAKRGVLGSEVEAAPAAASDAGLGEWIGQDASDDNSLTFPSLPL
jgi:hypothetical protein